MDMEEQPAYGEIQETVDPMDAFADVPNGPSTDALTELENEFARTVAEKQEKENALTVRPFECEAFRRPLRFS